MKKLIIFSMVFALLSPQMIFSISEEDFNAIHGNYLYYDPNAPLGDCFGAGNYSGLSEILPQEVIDRIRTLEPVYREVESETSVPWQIVAALHYREYNNLYEENPGSNNQGIMQLYSLTQGGNATHDFPAGRNISLNDPNDVAGNPTTKQSAKDQLKEAIIFLKGKKSSNYERNQRDLTLESAQDDSLVKDYFYSYNGRSYSRFAAEYGYDPATEGYEGSPYVMNMADPERMNMAIKTRDHGPIDGLDSRPGAFVVFKTLTSSTGELIDENLDDPNVVNDPSLGVELSPQAYRGAQEARRLGHTATIGGVAGRGNTSDHPTGYAIDVMSQTPGTVTTGSDKQLLDTIAQHFVTNRDALSVKYVIWYKKIAKASSNYEWVNYEHPSGASGPTLDHYDHVHISFTDDEGGGAIIDGACIGGN